MPIEGRTVHIDGDIIAYSCAAVCQIQRYVVLDIHTGHKFFDVVSKKEALQHQKEFLKVSIETEITSYIEEEDVSHALHNAKQLINKIVDKTQAENYAVFLSGETNFRDRIATIAPYKGHRTGDKPVHYEAVRQYLIDVHKAVEAPDMEADDCLGIFQTNDTVIATIDKDLDMVEGLHYNWRKDELYLVDKKEALRHFYHQLLTGDRTDNIIGCKGIGPKTADKILNKAETNLLSYTKEEVYFWYVLCEYEKHYEKPLEALIETARLLWIRRSPNQEWNPPC